MDAYKAARDAFWQTLRLKLQLFHDVVSKGANSEVTGCFIEELVCEFVRSWISPCLLLSGTMHPFDRNPECETHGVPQIDGVVFDPRQGPAIIREGSFVIANPQFCPGIIEIKTSVKSIKVFQDRLVGLHKQFYCSPNMVERSFHSVMGIVIHDSDPESHSHPAWLDEKETLYEPYYGGHCPIFVLFKEIKPGLEYEAYEPAIDAMMKTIFNHGWAFDPRLPQEIQRLEIQAKLRQASSGF